MFLSIIECFRRSEIENTTDKLCYMQFCGGVEQTLLN
jgi:hypothetical protein